MRKKIILIPIVLVAITLTVVFYPQEASAHGAPVYRVDTLDVYQSGSTTLGSGTAICTGVNIDTGTPSCSGTLYQGTQYRFEVTVSNQDPDGNGQPTTFQMQSAIGNLDVAGVTPSYGSAGCDTNTDWTASTSGTDINSASGTTCNITTSGGTAEYWFIVTLDADDADDDTATFYIDDGTVNDSSVAVSFTVDPAPGAPVYDVDLLDVYLSSSTTLDSGTVVCQDVDVNSASNSCGNFVAGNTYRLEVEVDNTDGSNAGTPTDFDWLDLVATNDAFGSITSGNILDYGCGTNTDWTGLTVDSGGDGDVRTAVGSGTSCTISALGNQEYWVIVTFDSDASYGTGTFFVDDGSVSDTSDIATAFTFDYTSSGTDTWTFVEQTTATVNYVRSGTDTWTFVDSYSAVPARSGEDVWSFTENTVVDNRSYVRDVTETWTFVEVTDVQGQKVRTSTDTWGFIESVNVVKPFSPGGKYISLSVAPPTEERLGGIFAMDCPTGTFAHGVFTNGTVICAENVVTKSFVLRSSTVGGDDTFIGGYYEWATGGDDFNPSVNFGDTVNSYHAHMSFVTGVQTPDELTIRVTGTSVTNTGVRTPADTEDIVIPSATPVNSYFETNKFWVGQVTISVVSGTPVDMNYGYSKYWDFKDSNFTVRGIDVTWYGGANDATADLKLVHHKPTGWVYSGAGKPDFSANIIDSLQTEHGAEAGTRNNIHGAWKETFWNDYINATNNEGVIFEVITSSARSFEYGNILLKVQRAD